MWNTSDRPVRYQQYDLKCRPVIPTNNKGRKALTLIYGSLLARCCVRVDKRTGSSTLSRTSRWSSESVRPPAVAGQFYPGSSAELERQLDEFMPPAEEMP